MVRHNGNDYFNAKLFIIMPEWFTKMRMVLCREINHHENGFMPELMVYHYGNGFMLERLTNTCMHHTKKESM